MRYQQQTLLGILLFIFVIIPGMVYAAFAIYDIALQPARRDDYCSAEISKSAHAVLIDVSDPLNQRQRDDLSIYLDRLVDHWRFDERLMIYVLNANIRSLPVPVFSSCRPPLKSTESSSGATETWLIDQAKPFLATTKKQFKTWLTSSSPGSESPIIEYIQAITAEPSFAGAAQRQIDLISDLGQNTNRYSEISNPIQLDATTINVLQIERRYSLQKNNPVLGYLKHAGAQVKVLAKLH